MPRVKLIQIRGGTASAWTTANPVLASREMGVETDTRKHKFGDGVTAWNSLAYAGDAGADHWKGDYDWSANADALPTWSPGDYGRSDGERGSFGDIGYVPDGCLIIKMGAGSDFNADFIFLRSNI